jgi:hypothetical protein
MSVMNIPKGVPSRLKVAYVKKKDITTHLIKKNK